MPTTQTHNDKPVVVTVRIPADLHRRLSQAAHQQGMSQSLLIADAIRLSVEAHESWMSAKNKGSVEAVLQDQIKTLEKLIAEKVDIESR